MWNVVLEIGVFVGYSAMVWAHAVGEGGKVTGLEFNPEYAKDAEKAFEKNGVKNVEVIVGDALEVYVPFSSKPNPLPSPLALQVEANARRSLKNLKPEEPYDLIFIDAQKSGYPTYLSQILSQSTPGSSSRLLRPGGLIVADNVLRRAVVADDSADNPYAADDAKVVERSEFAVSEDVERLREFNKGVVESKRLEAFLMPLFDGVSISRIVD